MNAGALEEGHAVVAQTLLDKLVLGTVDERNQHCELSQVLLLDLVASQVACLVVSNELHLCNHLIDLIGTGFLGLTTHVELLGSLGSIRGARSKTGGGCVVILGGHGLVELANSTGVELSINTYGLQLLNQGLTDSLGGGILTEDGELEGSLLAVLLVELAVLGVACIFQNLGCSSSIVVRGRVGVLVVLVEGHVNHRVGKLLFVIQALETNLGESLTVQTSDHSTTQSNILHAGGVHGHATGEQARASADLDVSNVLELLVCGSGGSTNRIKLIVLECRALSSGIHLTEDNALQNGLLAPPLVVAGQGQGLLGRVPTTFSNGEGANPVLGVRLVNETSVEEFLVQQSRVHNASKEGIQRVVRCGESYLHLEVITVALHGSNAAVDAAASDLVVTIGALEDVPGSLQSLVVDGGTVVELSLGVQLNGDDGQTVFFGDIEALRKLGSQSALTQGVTLPQACVSHGAHSGLGVQGVAVRAEKVEVRTNTRNSQAQSAAILQLRNSGLSKVIKLLGIGAHGCTLGGCLGVLGRAARSQYAHGTQCCSATENGTTVQDEILLHESVLLYV